VNDLEVAAVTDRALLASFQTVDMAVFDADFIALPADPIEERLPEVDGTAPDDGDVTLLRLALVGGEPVASAVMYLPTVDNLTAATIELRVHPDHRRRGYARAFLAVLLSELTSLGRPRIFFEVPSPYPSGEGPGEPLLREVGARPVLREIRRVVDLPAQPVHDLHKAPDGYRLVQWVDRAPDELVEDMAYLMHRMSIDAPLEEMDWEPEVWDVRRYRAKEETAGLRQRSRFATAVVHSDSGKIVGFTDIGVSRVAPETGYQWETLVLTEHRGRGLGLLLKAHNHRLVREGSPGTRWINTWNAESNTWMVAVNEALGFVPMEYWTEWQLDR